jgi:hypothetical protein
MVGVSSTTAISSDLLMPRRQVMAVSATTIDPSGTTTAIADSDVYGLTQPDVDKTMDMIKATGVRSVRLLIPWAGVEATQGQLDWSSVDKTVQSAASRGLAVVGVVNSTPLWAVAAGGQYLSSRPASPDTYGEFVAKVVARYDSVMSAVEIWNEPNGVMFFTPLPDPAGYVALLKAAYPRVKAVDPNIVVIGGSMGAVANFANVSIDPVTFLQQMYAAGARSYFDALAFHPYHYTLKFSDGMTVVNSPLYQLMGLRQTMIANNDAAKKIWATEYGEPSSQNGDSQENTFITDMLTKWQEMPYTGPMFIDTTRDRNTSSTSPEDTLGIYHTDWTPKTVQPTVQAGATGRIPKSPEYQRFATVTDPALGEILSPVYLATPQNYAQIRTVSTIFETSSGFITSPDPVADRARCYGNIPIGPFANGYQDFNNATGLRIWYSSATGAHPVSGGIASAWTPDLGLALTDEQTSVGGRYVDFQHGTISYVIGTGATVTRKENTDSSSTAPSACALGSTGSGAPSSGGSGGAGDSPGVTSPLASLLSLLTTILGLPGRLLAPQ